ncbi:MAG: KOW domain-containing RNA-binding protein [Eubacteriales bacterium]
MFVRSKAGHDKNRVYVVVRETEKEVWLVDGNLRTFQCPKKKRKRHIQIIKQYVSDEMIIKLKSNEVISKEEIKRQIKLYNGGIACQKQM